VTHATLDPYQKGDSALHRLDARVQLPLTLGFILVTALLPVRAWAVYLLLVAVVWAAALFSELGLGYVLKRSLIALPFALAALPVLFTIPGAPLWYIGSLTISQPGLERFAAVLLK
jgi:cobalt/nickel transport system permease protein